MDSNHLLNARSHTAQGPSGLIARLQQSARVESKAPGLARLMLHLGFHLLFFALILDSLRGVEIEQENVTVATANNYLKLSWIAAAFLVGFAYMIFLDRKLTFPIPHAVKQWVTVSAVAVGIMTLRSLLFTSPYPADDVFLDLLPWAALILLPILGHPYLKQDIETIFKLHSLVAVAVNMWVILQFGDRISSTDTLRTNLIPVKSGQILLYAIPYLAYIFYRLDVVYRAVTVVGIVQLVFIALVSQTRQAVVLHSIMIFLAFYIYRKHTRSDLGSSTRTETYGTVLFVLVVFLVYWRFDDIWQFYTEQTRQRFVTTDESASIEDNPRWEEISLLFEQLDFYEFVGGRGINGTFDNTATGAQAVHVGYFDAVLKGGFLLLGLIVLGTVRTSIRMFLSQPHYCVMPAAAVGVWFSVKLATGNILRTNATFYLVLICYGTLLYWQDRPDLFEPEPAGQTGQLAAEPDAA